MSQVYKGNRESLNKRLMSAVREDLASAVAFLTVGMGIRVCKHTAAGQAAIRASFFPEFWWAAVFAPLFICRGAADIQSSTDHLYGF